MTRENYYDSDKLKKITDKEFTFRLANPSDMTMDIRKLNSKSVIASYSFRYNTMTLFKRKVLQGAVSLEDMIKENERRGYEYLQ